MWSHWGKEKSEMHFRFCEVVQKFIRAIVSPSQLGEHGLFQRSNVQLLCPGAPRLGM